MQDIHAKALQAAEKLQSVFGNAPQVAIVLGSGLASVIPGLDQMARLPFANVPGFPEVNVVGHSGVISVGELLANGSARKVVVMSGRNHAYEGNTADQVVHGIRALLLWGVKSFVLTNAAGCLQPQWVLGSFMLLSDHVNLTGMNPLVGKHVEKFGPRFLDMTEAYDKEYQIHFRKVAESLGHKTYSGVYFGLLGSTYETPAEIKMFRAMGADAVGMSTVLESIAIRHGGGRVVAMSCLTNYAAGLIPGSLLNHDEVVSTGKSAAHACSEILVNACVTLDTV